MADKFLDIESGNDANDGSSYANRVKTFKRAAAILSPGDRLKIKAVESVNSLGTDVTWVDVSSYCTPATPQWVVLDDCESGWVASANVTLAYATTCKVGSAALQITISASFGTGKACYKQISSTDCSAYQQLTFWLRTITTATWPSNISIKLCSDTSGNTPVDTITIPSGGYGTTQLFNPMLIDKGSAFGNAIQSVAIYVDSDIGAQTIEIDNIVAVKAPGSGEISLLHMIGQPDSVGAGGADTENWFAIRGFSTTQVLLDAHWNAAFSPLSLPRQRCVAGTVAGKCQKLPSIATPNADTNFDYGDFVGTSSSKITISGGWNRTDMSTQTHHSWMSWAHHNASNQTFLVTNIFANCIWERVHFSQVATSALNFINCTVGKLCCVMSSNVFSILADSSTFDGLYISSSANNTSSFANSTVSDLVYYSSIGFKRCSMSQCSNSTIYCDDGTLWDAPALFANIITPTTDMYSAGYAAQTLRRGVVFGTVGSSASTTSIPTSSLSPAAAVTDQFKNRIVVFDRNTATANLRGQVASISASTSGGTLTVSALTTAPASGDTFMIV